MKSFTLIFVCAQAFVIQSALGQCSSIPPCSVPAPAPVPACAAAAPYYPSPVPSAVLPWGTGYGIKVAGDNLVIDGLAQVSGTIPFVSSVQLDGDVPADGAASLRNACCCGDALLR